MKNCISTKNLCTHDIYYLISKTRTETNLIIISTWNIYWNIFRSRKVKKNLRGLFFFLELLMILNVLRNSSEIRSGKQENCELCFKADNWDETVWFTSHFILFWRVFSPISLSIIWVVFFLAFSDNFFEAFSAPEEVLFYVYMCRYFSVFIFLNLTVAKCFKKSEKHFFFNCLSWELKFQAITRKRKCFLWAYTKRVAIKIGKT